MVFLMYHELETAGRPLCQDAPGYVRYAIREEDFRTQMKHLAEIGWSGVDVGQALTFRPSTVAITFDDGCESDLVIAAPILRELGFGATFYITVGFLGKRGYLTANQLRELSSLGFEIGSHSMSHAYLSDLNESDLRREIVDSKTALEQLIAKDVTLFSCPGGRYNQRALDIARETGYTTVATSRACINSPSTDPFQLGRIPIMRTTSLHEFERYCKGNGLWSLRARNKLREGMQQTLGNSVYDRLRDTLLRK